jgi:hypothetical protein
MNDTAVTRKKRERAVVIASIERIHPGRGD